MRPFAVRVCSPIKEGGSGGVPGHRQRLWHPPLAGHQGSTRIPRVAPLPAGRGWGLLARQDNPSGEKERDGNDEGGRVRRSTGFSFGTPFMEPRIRRVQQGGKSVSFRGGIMIGARTPSIPYQGIMMADRYKTVATDGIVRPFQVNHGHQFVLVDDNAPAHRAQQVNAALREYEITSNLFGRRNNYSKTSSFSSWITNAVVRRCPQCAALTARKMIFDSLKVS
ncbi:hypothetical protein evm_006154 [Chilo suppressalis]|nr:hypothetical protein evm_006154 [Chilo suppressalis]